MLVSTAEQNESAVHRHVSPPFRTSSLCTSLQRFEQAPLCSIQCVLTGYQLYTWDQQCMVSTQPLSSPHPCLRLWYPHIGSLCLCLYFCFANKVISVIFSRSHIYALTHDICFSDLLHSVSRSLGFRVVGNRICSSSLWSINYVILGSILKSKTCKRMLSL